MVLFSQVLFRRRCSTIFHPITILWVIFIRCLPIPMDAPLPSASTPPWCSSPMRYSIISFKVHSNRFFLGPFEFQRNFIKVCICRIWLFCCHQEILNKTLSEWSSWFTGIRRRLLLSSEALLQFRAWLRSPTARNSEGRGRMSGGEMFFFFCDRSITRWLQVSLIHDP